MLFVFLIYFLLLLLLALFSGVILYNLFSYQVEGSQASKATTLFLLIEGTLVVGSLIVGLLLLL